MSTRKVLLILILTLVVAKIGAQNISLSDLQIKTIGFIPEGTETPLLSTQGTIAGRFVPAHWIRFNSQLSLDIPDSVLFFSPVNSFATQGTLNFDGGSVDFPNIFRSGVNFSLFTGYYDDLLSGNLLRESLKIDIDSPEFYENPAGMLLCPESRITGTGIALKTVPGNKNMVVALYGYWNTLTDSNANSSYDIRFSGDFNSLRLNAFGGISVEMNKATASFKGGFSSVFGAGSNNELYTSVGFKNYTIGSPMIDRNISVIFEPRMHWEKADLILSFFSSPLFLPDNLNADSVSNFIGTNILLGIGNLKLHKMRGGISLLGYINPQVPTSTASSAFTVSPFYSVLISDFLLDITAVIKPLSFNLPYSMVGLQLGLKAVY